MKTQDLAKVPVNEISVACVIGNEVRYYSPMVREHRSFEISQTFPHRGAALQAANDFEEQEKQAWLRRQSR